MAKVEIEPASLEWYNQEYLPPGRGILEQDYKSRVSGSLGRVIPNLVQISAMLEQNYTI